MEQELLSVCLTAQKLEKKYSLEIEAEASIRLQLLGGSFKALMESKDGFNILK